MRTAEDERFVESFKHYVDLLVEESVHEINGWKAVPKEKFEEAGNRLVEAARAVGISENAEKLVEQTNALAGYRMLAPEPGAICSTPSGNSIDTLVETFDGFAEYFESVGLVISNASSDFDGRPVIGICVGAAQKIDMPAGPDVVLFTKTIVDSTTDAIVNKVTDSNACSDWTTFDAIYYQLEPKLRMGNEVWPALKWYSDMQATWFTLTGKKYRPDDVIVKLEELAWMPLLNEVEDRDGFSKRYAALYTEDHHPHEIYHVIAKNQEGSLVEAAAQLYAVLRGSNPFDCLRALYEWKVGKLHKYSHAAEIAFKQLETAGYDESLWKELDPIDTEKVNAAGSEIRRLAGLALGNIEEGLQWKKHEEAERELGLPGNYRKLHEELQNLAGGLNYGG